MAQGRHTELESFTLGLVWRHGPCTAYAVRRMLQDSPSTMWSGSAGSIYPLLRRLERQRLLTSRPQKQGRRASRAYSVTKAGMAALRRWVGPPLPDEAVTVTYDPLRSRLRFLDVLVPADRGAWIDAADDALRTVGDRVLRWRDLYGGEGGVFGTLLTRHGELDVKMRQAWLREVREAFKR